MAQLDLTTFIPQLFWFLILFLSLYSISFAYLLPRIAKGVKARNKTIRLFESNVSDKQVDKVLSERYILDVLEYYKNLVLKISTKSSSNFNSLKKQLMSKYQNHFFLDKIYTHSISSKND